MFDQEQACKPPDSNYMLKLHRHSSAALVHVLDFFFWVCLVFNKWIQAVKCIQFKYDQTWTLEWNSDPVSSQRADGCSTHRFLINGQYLLQRFLWSPEPWRSCCCRMNICTLLSFFSIWSRCCMSKCEEQRVVSSNPHSGRVDQLNTFPPWVNSAGCIQTKSIDQTPCCELECVQCGGRLTFKK